MHTHIFLRNRQTHALLIIFYIQASVKEKIFEVISVRGFNEARGLLF